MQICIVNEFSPEVAHCLQRCCANDIRDGLVDVIPTFTYMSPSGIISRVVLPLFVASEVGLSVPLLFCSLKEEPLKSTTFMACLEGRLPLSYGKRIVLQEGDVERGAKPKEECWGLDDHCEVRGFDISLARP